jgi:hypothetical protein
MADKPNLDLIHMVQRARMEHDSQATPSEITGVYWIESKPLSEGPPPSSHAGSWVIPTNADEVDSLWAKIKAATEAGELGYKSKVSTAPGKGQRKPQDRLIIVRTQDADDPADLARVERRLHDMGISPHIYERD